MTRWLLFCVCALGTMYKAASAQLPASGMPTQLTIARETFFDFGPPFNFYEIIKVTPDEDRLSIQRVLVTPPGIACVQPAKVELSSGILHESMAQLLRFKNPCAISEKQLRRERQRRKKSQVFSGMNVTMQMSCSGKDRQIRTDILDRDLFASSPGTPKNTSWSMAVLQNLDSVLGPGAMDKPTFPIETKSQGEPKRGKLIDQLLAGTFDQLFGPQVKVSEIAQDAMKGPPLPPTIKIENVSPIEPISADLPNYPPIAKLARVEGLVEATFEVGDDGTVRNMKFTNEPRLGMLQPAVRESILKWKFPPSARGKSEEASISFVLNCKAEHP